MIFYWKVERLPGGRLKVSYYEGPGHALTKEEVERTCEPHVEEHDWPEGEPMWFCTTLDDRVRCHE